MTIGNFDYYADFKFAAANFSLASDTLINGYSELMINNISLIGDSTKAVVSLDSFNLGPDRFRFQTAPVTIGGQAGFLHYFWNTGDTSRFITVSQPGTYWCMVDYGCSSFTDTIRILVPAPLPSQGFLGPDKAVCYDSTLTLTAPAGFQYRWNTGSRTRSIGAASGQYNCTLFNGCDSIRDEIAIVRLVAPAPGRIISGGTQLCVNGALTPVRLLANSGNPLLWSNGDTARATFISTPGWAVVTESNACGTASDSVYMRGCPIKLFFPTAFSPNGDGLNEGFGPSSAYLGDIGGYRLQVFDRWGDRVFSASSPSERWRPADALQGVYNFYCEYTDTSKEPQKVSGTVMLFR